jgi:hypothetical protein
MELKKVVPISIMMLVLANLAGWTIYATIKMAINDGLIRLGVEGAYTQNLILLTLILILLMALGKDLKEVLD